MVEKQKHTDFHEEMANKIYCNDLAKRIQIIDRELIRLIDAKHRYEMELQKHLGQEANKHKSK